MTDVECRSSVDFDIPVVTNSSNIEALAKSLQEWAEFFPSDANVHVSFYGEGLETRMSLSATWTEDR